MRLILKILSLPIILITWVLYGLCRLLVLASGVILGILSVMALIAAACCSSKRAQYPAPRY